MANYGYLLIAACSPNNNRTDDLIDPPWNVNVSLVAINHVDGLVTPFATAAGNESRHAEGMKSADWRHLFTS